MRLSLFQGIVLGVFGIAALIGIFVFANYSGGGGTGPQVGTVVIWGTLPKAQITEALTVASRINTDLKGVAYVQKSSSTFRTDLVAAIAAGSGPDMVLISQEDLLSLSKVILPILPGTLSERTFRDAFASAGELFLAPDASGAYGVPFLINPLVLYQNRTILASSGIAQAPATWEALTGLVPKVTTKTPTGNIDRALVALGTYSNIDNARGILSALFIQAGVPIGTRTSTGVRRADLGTSLAEGTPPGQAVLRFYTQFADSSKVSYTWNASLPTAQQRSTSCLCHSLVPGVPRAPSHWSTRLPYHAARITLQVRTSLRLNSLALGPTKRLRLRQVWLLLPVPSSPRPRGSPLRRWPIPRRFTPRVGCPQRPRIPIAFFRL